MKIHIKFLTKVFLQSFVYVSLIVLSLVFIINFWVNLNFLKKLRLILFTLYLSLINSPAVLFELFPFIFLITTQLFFIKLFEKIRFKYLNIQVLKTQKFLWL